MKKNTKKINVMKNCMKECNQVSFIAYEKRVKKIFAKKIIKPEKCLLDLFYVFFCFVFNLIAV